MHYLALATDYDGTLAHHGRVDDATLAALERLLQSGRKLILVTGRELEELLGVFPRIDLFEWVVAENGGLLYQPASREPRLLGQAPPESFVQTLRQRGVAPVSVGRVIVATWHPHETTVLETIRDLGLELQVIFNKDAVMVLPAGLNKATGLAAALRELGLSGQNIVGIGDAENDHAFLSQCGCSAVVANALPALKERGGPGHAGRPRCRGSGTDRRAAGRRPGPLRGLSEAAGPPPLMKGGLGGLLLALTMLQSLRTFGNNVAARFQRAGKYGTLKTCRHISSRGFKNGCASKMGRLYGPNGLYRAPGN